MFNFRSLPGPAWFAAGAITVFVGTFCLQGCGHRNGILAVMNGEAIPMDEYYQYLENKPAVNVRAPSGSLALPVDGSLGFQAMRDVLEQSAALQIAKEKGLYPTAADVDAELKLRMSQNPAYLSNLLADGLTLDVIKKNITVDLAQEKILTQGITVSDQDLDKYIADHRKEFVTPESVELSCVVVNKPDDEKAVEDELNQGKSFTDVARDLSKLPNAQSNNGKLTAGPVAVQSLPAGLRKALTDLQEGESTGWIKIDEGYARFRLDRRHAAAPIKIDAAKKQLIRRALAKTKGEKAHDLSKMILAKLSESKVDVVQPQYADSWRAEMQLLKDQLKK